MHARWITVLSTAATIAALGSVVATAGATAGAGEEGDEAVDWSAKAKQAWSHTCQKCHTVPDATFETGRAFLSQIRETS